MCAARCMVANRQSVLGERERERESVNNRALARKVRWPWGDNNDDFIIEWFWLAQNWETRRAGERGTSNVVCQPLNLWHQPVLFVISASLWLCLYKEGGGGQGLSIKVGVGLICSPDQGVESSCPDRWRTHCTRTTNLARTYSATESREVIHVNY